MFEQSDFKFFGEETFWQAGTFLSERSGLEFVAGRLYDFQFEREFRERRAALGEDRIGLGQREGAAAGSKDDDVARVQGAENLRCTIYVPVESISALVNRKW